MAIPIPHILSHAVASINTETRESFDLFESLIVRLEPAFKREIRFRTDVRLEFPQLVASYLLSSLQRVRVTSWGVVSAVNAPNEVLFVLAVRSMLESAANIAYLRANMLKTYAGEVPRRDMTRLSLRMKFATRKPGDFKFSSEEASQVSSVNVLSALKTLDRFASTEIGFANDKSMTNWYERLCEFSHPNCMGNSVGSELDYPGGLETFEIDPGMRPGVLEQFGNYVYGSLYLFCLNYNECWQMMADAKEILPTWTPPELPKIVLD
jgi:hypothetical protein